MSRSVSQAQIERCIRAATRLGVPIKGMRLRSDGSVDLLTEVDSLPTAAHDATDQEWAAWDAEHGGG